MLVGIVETSRRSTINKSLRPVKNFTRRVAISVRKCEKNLAEDPEFMKSFEIFKKGPKKCLSGARVINEKSSLCKADD